jgi:UDP-glucose 4-epimerase
VDRSTRGASQSDGRNFGAVTTFVRHALDGLPITIFGDGSVVRDFLHISDAASAIVTAAQIRETSPALNIGSGVGHSLADVARTVEEIGARPLKREYQPSRVFDVPVSVLDISLARKDLNWQPRLTFQEGVAEVFQALASRHRGLDRSDDLADC